MIKIFVKLFEIFVLPHVQKYISEEKKIKKILNFVKIIIFIYSVSFFITFPFAVVSFILHYFFYNTFTKYIFDLRLKNEILKRILSSFDFLLLVKIVNALYFWLICSLVIAVILATIYRRFRHIEIVKAVVEAVNVELTDELSANNIRRDIAEILMNAIEAPVIMMDAKELEIVEVNKGFRQWCLSNNISTTLKGRNLLRFFSVDSLEEISVMVWHDNRKFRFKVTSYRLNGHTLMKLTAI